MGALWIRIPLVKGEFYLQKCHPLLLLFLQLDNELGFHFDQDLCGRAVGKSEDGENQRQTVTFIAKLVLYIRTPLPRN